MPRIRIASLALLATLALAGVAAFAATAKPEPADPERGFEPTRAERDWHDWRDHEGPGHRHFHREGPGRGLAERRMAFRAANNPSASVLRDLVALERMYRRNGREQDVPGLYRDVLARTSDPVVRHIAGGRLARLEWQAGNKDAAVEQMRKNLDADLKRLK